MLEGLVISKIHICSSISWFHVNVMWWAMLMMLRITTVLMRSQPVTLLTWHPSSFTLFTSRYTCCLRAYNTSHYVSNVISRRGWNDNMDRIDCQADVVDDGGLGTLPQLWLVQMVFACGSVHEYFTLDRHLPLAVFDSRNDDTNDAGGF